jgi:hypothetical protein
MYKVKMKNKRKYFSPIMLSHEDSYTVFEQTCENHHGPGENQISSEYIIGKYLTFVLITRINMEYILEIIKIIVPALLVFLCAWLLLRNMIRNDQDRRRQEIILLGAKNVTPIKLQAYERIVLFLERISLESLLIRVSSPEMTAAQLQSALLTTIRNEYEHNLSQQIYMSPQAWEVVKNARSNTIKIINSEAEKIKGDAPSIELSRRILSTIMELEKEPTRVAIEFVKEEVGRII